MSILTKHTYNNWVGRVIVLLFLISGYTFGMSCCNNMESGEPKSDCCSDSQKGASSCYMEMFGVDNMNAPHECPCVITNTKAGHDAVVATRTISFNVPSVSVEYETEPEVLYSLVNHTVTLHKIHSNKTYKFIESYLN